MIGEKLHNFDLQLCEYALDNVGKCLRKRVPARYAKQQIDLPVLNYLSVLEKDDEPPRLLLNDQEFQYLIMAFESGPLEYDPSWVCDERAHRQHIDCAREVRIGLSEKYANWWARGSARRSRRLEEEDVHLSRGLRIIQAWVKQIRRLLRALDATALIPQPEGAFPTPTFPESQPLSSGPAQPAIRGAGTLEAALAETQGLQREIRDLLLRQRTVRDFYTTAEVAKLLGKAEFTVREWCRNGRVRGQKQGSGRGKHQAWVIGHDELQRLQRDGLLPAEKS